MGWGRREEVQIASSEHSRRPSTLLNCYRVNKCLQCNWTHILAKLSASLNFTIRYVSGRGGGGYLRSGKVPSEPGAGIEGASSRTLPSKKASKASAMAGQASSGGGPSPLTYAMLMEGKPAFTIALNATVEARQRFSV